MLVLVLVRQQWQGPAAAQSDRPKQGLW